jgi:hypothetical protein
MRLPLGQQEDLHQGPWPWLGVSVAHEVAHAHGHDAQEVREGALPVTVDPRLRQANRLDRDYSRSEAFHRKRLEEWLEKVTVLFTKRTDYPKLGYIIHRLNEEGIPSILHGQSFHGPILRVHKEHEEAAWRILAEKVGRSRKSLDDLDDDDPRFAAYASVQPDRDLWEG